MSPRSQACRRGLASAAVVLLLVSGCSSRELSFRQDDTVSYVSPGENEEVTLPFELDWAVEDHEGLFGVFFDRTPMRPGQDLSSLVSDDDSCSRDPACPDEEWLGDRYIFVTEQTSLDVELLPDERNRGQDRDRHEVTIVLLDESGRRINEAVFIREFIVERSD